MYLADMHKVRVEQPGEWTKLTSQYHNVRRTNAYYCAISTDLAIEQVFMANLKERAGLTRINQPISDASFRKWALSRALLAEMSDGVHALTGVLRTSGEQHSAVTRTGKVRSRHATDARDLTAVAECLAAHHPFDPEREGFKTSTPHARPRLTATWTARSKGASGAWTTWPARS